MVMHRDNFQLLDQTVNGHPLIYLDNAATTQKPKEVIHSILDYYTRLNSNIHRGVHYLSQQATTAFEEARTAVQHFINATHQHEIIFTKGTTESINLVASSFGKAFLHEGDEVIISEMEHHSNIVPWQMICEEKKAHLKVLPIDEDGNLKIEELDLLLTKRTKIIAITHISNALGTINPIKRIIEIAHQKDIPVLIDGAQAMSHQPVDVQVLDCDFYCFSGHKMYGPMGVGVLYGKEAWLEKLPPYQGGGEMIQRVTFAHTTFNELPFKFEAGTPNVADVIGLKSAIDYLNRIGISTIAQYENELLEYGAQQLLSIPGLSIIGKAKEKASIISFILDRIHPYDAGLLIDKWGIAVRTGHHCAQPIMDKYGIPGTIRASFALYNTKEEIDRLVDTIKRVQMMLL
jgi:cysteine desulfurase/selenocysteine lyase